MDRRNPLTTSSSRRRTAPGGQSSKAALPSRAAPSDGLHEPARAGFGAWLSVGRTARGLSREQVARTTRIQLRTIERLEEARFDELPADVFVRGFVRNYARCVGLPVDEALARYSACGFAAAPVASAQARALLDSMAALAPDAARAAAQSSVSAPRVLRDQPEAPAFEMPASSGSFAASDGTVETAATAATAASDDVAAAPARSSRRKRGGAAGPRQRDARGRFVRRAEAADAADPAAEQLAEAAAAAAGLGAAARAAEVAAAAVELADALTDPRDPRDAAAALLGDDDLDVEITFLDDDHDLLDVDPADHGAEPPAVAAAPSVTVVRVPQAPTLVIDDDDPDSAEREQEDRARERDGGWRSFLPPALLDQDRGRQGGLTLAVIILLIVATLTLSYLMRRPSSTGEGVTAIPSAPTHVG